MKRIVLVALAAIIFTPTIIQSSQAGPSSALSAKRHHHKKAIDASGNSAETCAVTSRKTGATARVGCAYVAAFQGYIDDLEGNHGSAVHFMGGTRRGKCWSGSLHPCGKALDVCQLSRGRVDAKCHLPDRAQLAAIAERHGLVEGGRWANSDYGHAQVGGYAGRTVAEMGSGDYSTKRHADVIVATDNWREAY